MEKRLHYYYALNNERSVETGIVIGIVIDTEYDLIRIGALIDRAVYETAFRKIEEVEAKLIKLL